MKDVKKTGNSVDKEKEGRIRRRKDGKMNVERRKGRKEDEYER